MPDVRSNQNAESAVSTRPLSGIGVGMITSKALMRSDATINMVSPKLYISRTLPEASCSDDSASDMLDLHGVERAVEDQVDVPQEAVQVEHAVEGSRVEQRACVGVALEQPAERDLLVP